MENKKITQAPPKKELPYRSNASLLYAAAKNLGYKLTDIEVNGKRNLSRYGFYVEHKNKRCYF